MNARAAFSIIETMVAAAVVAVGLTAAAVLAASIMAQQERDTATLRAANLQEQAVRLYRMDLSHALILSLLPEDCRASGAPPTNGYVLSFTRSAPVSLDVDGVNVAVERTGSTISYAPAGADGGARTNSVTILRPTLRVKYTQ